MGKELKMILYKECKTLEKSTDDTIFPNKPTDSELLNPVYLEDFVFGRIWYNCYFNKLTVYTNEGDRIQSGLHINLYIPDPETPIILLSSALNTCSLLNIKVTLWYYNKAKDEYFSQEVY